MKNQVAFTAQKSAQENIVFMKARHVSGGTPGIVGALYRFGQFTRAFVVSPTQRQSFESGKRINITSDMIRKLEFYR